MIELTEDLVRCLTLVWKNGMADGRNRAYRLLLESLTDLGAIVFRFHLNIVRDGISIPATPLPDPLESWLYERAVQQGHELYVQALTDVFGPLHSELFAARFLLAVENRYGELEKPDFFETALEELCRKFLIHFQMREVNGI